MFRAKFILKLAAMSLTNILFIKLKSPGFEVWLMCFTNAFNNKTFFAFKIKIKLLFTKYYLIKINSIFHASTKLGQW